MKKIKFILIGFFSIIISYFNILKLPVMLLVVFNILDILTGVIKSLYINDKITFKYLIWGITKKICMYILIFVGLSIDIVINYTVENLNIIFDGNQLFSGLIAIYLVLDEQLSILRNLVVLEIPMPNFLISIIKKLKLTINK